MKNKTTKAKKGTIKLATPVPFVGLEHKDLVAVSLEDLTEAQKEHEKEVEKAKLEVIEEIEGYVKGLHLKTWQPEDSPIISTDVTGSVLIRLNNLKKRQGKNEKKNKR